MRECNFCGKSIVRRNAQARFCSDKCRNYARLRRLRSPLPEQLTEKDRWVRRTRSKVPLTVTGEPASSTDPATWSTYSAAAASRKGIGLGFVLGDGIACVDLDHVVTGDGIDARALALIEKIKPFYVELSPSGDGLHAWLTSPSPTGRKRYRQEDGLSVEWYDSDRYITVTGERVTP